MRQSLTPEAAEARHVEVDTLRGAALCGVLLVNLLVAFRVSLLQHILEFHTHPGRLNQAVDLLLGVFVETKAVAIFSLLFGVSTAIHAERIGKRGQSYAKLAVRRLLVLLGIGAVHMVFIWNGDILVEYALAGLMVLPALWLPRQLGLGAALFLLFLPTLPLRLPLPAVDWSAVGEHVAVATRVYSRGGYLEIFSFRQLETWRFIGPLLCGILLRTMGLMLLGQFVWRRGILRAPQAHRRLLGWVALNLLHAAVFDSANPESLAPVMTGLVILGSASLLDEHGPGGRRASWLRVAVAIAAVAVVARAHLTETREARRAAQELRDLVDLAAPSPAPMADLCRLLDAELPRDALLLVSDRLHASYFHIYTRRRPLVTEYLDASPETLRQRFALTSLSLRIYSPQLDSAAITAAIAAGRPVYLLSAEPRPGLPQRDLPWDGLHLYTLSPVIF